MGQAYCIVSMGIFQELVFGLHVRPPASTTGQLQVVGAGFARTGTKSIQRALELAGNHKIYDIRAANQHCHEADWVHATREWKHNNNNNLEPLERILQKVEALGYTATLDTSMNEFVPAFIVLRPRAKVVLSVRDDGSPKNGLNCFYILFFLQIVGLGN
mmetsp:Transcript_1349/g.2413  ORF Transcript_1349/g.2413 Transcript_1349/m.2413 type:complete len:159 (-) Transcript_1349:277-753(-)